MPIYHHFYIEQRQAAGWGVPPHFQAEPWTFEQDRALGGFAWVHPRRRWLALFWGENALFPMRAGAPAERQGSPLLQQLDPFYDYERNDENLCWLPYADLLIDEWDTHGLLLGANLPARYAPLFADGQQPFPTTALLAAGMDSAAQQPQLENAWLATAPVNTTFGRARFQLDALPPDHAVPVTWQATVAAFIGEPHARLFRELRRYGPDESLRILSKRG